MTLDVKMSNGTEGDGMGRIWTALQFAVAAMVAWWAGLYNIYKILLALQMLDIASGVLAASRASSLSSAIGRVGVRRKMVAWILIIALALAQTELVQVLSVPSLIAGYGPAELMAAALAFMEFVSVVENADRLGVPLPNWLRVSLSSTLRTLGYEERVAEAERTEGKL